ncbi:MAG: PCP reductase family protein [Synechococcus sp. ELA619]
MAQALVGRHGTPLWQSAEFLPLGWLAAGLVSPSPNLLQPCCIPGGWAMNWNADAEAKLKEIPFFVRPAVRRRVESLAADAGLDRVDLQFFEEAKAQFGQK